MVAELRTGSPRPPRPAIASAPRWPPAGSTATRSPTSPIGVPYEQRRRRRRARRSSCTSSRAPPSGLTATGSQVWSQNSAGVGDERGERRPVRRRAGRSPTSTGTSFEDLAIGAPGEDVLGAVDAGLVHAAPRQRIAADRHWSQTWSQDTPAGIDDQVETGRSFRERAGHRELTYIGVRSVRRPGHRRPRPRASAPSLAPASCRSSAATPRAWPASAATRTGPRTPPASPTRPSPATASGADSAADPPGRLVLDVGERPPARRSRGATEAAALSAQHLQELLGLSDEELLAVLDEDPLTLIVRRAGPPGGAADPARPAGRRRGARRRAGAAALGARRRAGRAAAGPPARARLRGVRGRAGHARRARLRAALGGG